MMRAKPTITDTTMTAIFHGSIRFIALSIWITICIEENDVEKFNSITKAVVYPEPNHIWHSLAQLTNHTEWGRLGRTSGPCRSDLLLKPGATTTGYSRLCPAKFLAPSRTGSQSPRSPAPVSDHPHSKSFFFIFSQNFLCSNLLPLPHIYLWEKPRAVQV